MASPLQKLFMRHNKDPESARQRIFDWFIRPLLLFLYDDLKADNWHLLIESVFCTDDRHIFLAKATRGFKLPGNYVLIPNKPIAGYGDRKVVVGTTFYVRFDRQTERVDLQFAVSKDEIFYRLTKNEFAGIADHLKILEGAL